MHPTLKQSVETLDIELQLLNNSTGGNCPLEEERIALTFSLTGRYAAIYRFLMRLNTLLGTKNTDLVKNILKRGILKTYEYQMSIIKKGV